MSFATRFRLYFGVYCIMAIDLLIADDHEVVRAGLRTLLEGTDIHIVAAATGGAAALKLAKKHRPALVLHDVRMWEVNGLDCLFFQAEDGIRDYRVTEFNVCSSI